MRSCAPAATTSTPTRWSAVGRRLGQGAQQRLSATDGPFAETKEHLEPGSSSLRRAISTMRSASPAPSPRPASARRGASGQAAQRDGHWRLRGFRRCIRREHRRPAGGDLPQPFAPRAGHADPPARRFRASPRRRCTTPSPRPPRNGRSDGVPANPFAWLVSAGRFKAIDGIRQQARFDASLTKLAMRLEADADEPEMRGRRRPSRTTSSADLHLLPSGAAARRAGGADAARGLRADHRGDRARLPHRAADDRPAHRAGQGEDPRRADSLSRCRPATSSPARLDDVLSVIYLVFNEGYSAASGAVADAARSVGGGDPARPAAGRAAARSRGAGLAGADAAPRIAARRARHAARAR